MLGYWKNPEATSKAITKDGWFKTGDLATLDEEGFLYIRDRGQSHRKPYYWQTQHNFPDIVKDIIIRGGENIVSAATGRMLSMVLKIPSFRIRRRLKTHCIVIQGCLNARRWEYPILSLVNFPLPS